MRECYCEEQSLAEHDDASDQLSEEPLGRPKNMISHSSGKRSLYDIVYITWRLTASACEPDISGWTSSPTTLKMMFKF